jgi:probable phosphoglycerate mutase
MPATIAGIIDRAIAEATAWGAPHREVVLVRHGQPLPEEERRAGEALDPPLSGLGRRQATAASCALAGVEAVYGSDLARAAETAQIIGDRLGLPVRTMPGLREVTVYRGSGEDLTTWRTAAAAFVQTGRWASFLQPDPDFRVRVRHAMKEIAAVRTTGAVAVVCHSGVINAHLADALALDRDYFVRPFHASLTRVRLAAGRWRVQSVNETAHLAAGLLSA